jgi:hypothetical protein
MVLVDIVDNSVRGLDIGDEAVFTRHRMPEPGDIALAVFSIKPALIGRYLPGPGSDYQLATDDGKAPHAVNASGVIWRGVLSRRTKYGSR